MKDKKISLSPEEQLLARKNQLLQDSKSYEQGIQEEIAGLKEDFQKILRIGLMLAGFALGAYWLLRTLRGHTEEALPSEEKAPSQDSPVYQKVEEDSIFAIIKREIALFLVAIAKQKILEMMAAFAENTKEAAPEAPNQDPEDA